MPTVTEGIVTGFNSLAQIKDNILDAIDAIDRREIPFLASLGWAMEGDVTKAVNSLKFPCTQPQHTWQNDVLVPNTTTMNAAYASGAATIVVAAGTADYFIIDDEIIATSGNNTSHWRVTAIDLDTDTLSVINLGGDANHANGTRIYSSGRPSLRGEQYSTVGKTTTITTQTNFTQIFGGGKDGVVAVDGTDQSTEYWGISDQYAYQVTKRLAELAIKLEQAAMYGLRSATFPTSNSQPASRMGGLYYWIINQTGSNTSNANGTDLMANEGTLKGLLDTIWDAGGAPSLMMMNTFNRRKISDILAPFVQVPRSEHVMGIIVNQYEYSHGMLNVALNKWVHPQHVWVLSPEYLGVGPLAGNGRERSFMVEPMPKDGDYERTAIIGESNVGSTISRGVVKNFSDAGRVTQRSLEIEANGEPCDGNPVASKKVLPFRAAVTTEREALKQVA